MVNSKKMSKSSIAVIVLSILLVLSMILGLTGAWFTSSTGDKSATSEGITFGKVELEGSEAAITANIDEINAELATDGDTWEVSAGSITNKSTVDIFVRVKTGFMLYKDAECTQEADETVKGYFSLSAGSFATVATNYYYIKADGGAISGAQSAVTVTLSSNGVANGVTGTYYLKSTYQADAIQAANITQGELETLWGCTSGDLASVFADRTAATAA